MDNQTTQTTRTLLNVGVDVNFTPLSALYLALALTLPIVVFFVMRKAMR